MEVPTGLVSDLIGRKRSMIVGALFSFMALLLYAIGFNVWVLFLGAFCEGMGRSLFSGTDKALLYETLRAQKKSDQFDKIFGKITSVEQLSLGVSAVLGGVLALISLKFVMWVAVIPALFSMVCAVCFGEATFYFQAAFFNLLVPQWLIGLVRGMHHLFGAIGFWTAGHILKRFGYKQVLIIGNAASRLIEFIVVLIPSPLSPFVMAMLNVNYGYSSTASHSLMQRDFSDKQRATMGSMVSLTGSLFFAMVSVLLGFIADVSNPGYAMLFGMSSSVLIIWIYTRLFSRSHNG